MDHYQKDIDALMQALNQIVENGWGSCNKTIALQAIAEQQRREIARGVLTGNMPNWIGRP